MHYSSFFIELDEWFDEQDEAPPLAAMERMFSFLEDNGYNFLEHEISGLLEGFIGHSINQYSLNQEDRLDWFFSRELPPLFVTVAKKDKVLSFFDLDPIFGDEEVVSYRLEVDIFGPDGGEVEDIEEELTEKSMKCFGLTDSRDQIVSHRSSTAALAQEKIEDELSLREPID